MAWRRPKDHHHNNAHEEVIEQKNQEEGKDECPFCFELLKPDVEAVERLPCRHQFHALCMDRWEVRSPTCPTCRGDLEKKEEGCGVYWCGSNKLEGVVERLPCGHRVHDKCLRTWRRAGMQSCPTCQRFALE